MPRCSFVPCQAGVWWILVALASSSCAFASEGSAHYLAAAWHGSGRGLLSETADHATALSPVGEAASPYGAVGVAGICATAMAVGTFIIFVVKIPPKVEAATQNFSAGGLAQVSLGAASSTIPPSRRRARPRAAPCFKEAEWLISECNVPCAGILVAAIAGELFPLLHGSGGHRREGVAPGSDEPGFTKTFGMMVGFVFGIALMFGQKHILEHHEGNSDVMPPRRMNAALRLFLMPLVFGSGFSASF